jgi:hypothetical protein
MKNSAVALLLFLFIGFSASAQSLEFLGLPEISFGMKLKALNDAQLILDSSSSYNDTALYLRSTRCQMYYRKNENFTLKGFTASRIEYEFCDSTLGYVFIYASGKENISNALSSLQLSFTKMGCGKNIPLGSCALIDTHNKDLRLIMHIDHAKQEMNMVIIPRKSAR